MNANSSMYSRVLGGAIAVGLLALATYGVVQSQEYEPGLLSTGQTSLEFLEGERSFSFSSDPGLRLLHVAYSGGAIAHATSYSLYSDGRLEIKLSDPGGDKRVLHTYEQQLVYEEIKDMLELVVFAGFIESSKDSVHARMRAALGQALPRSSDSPDMTVVLNLESYLGPGRREAAPATNRITLHDPSVYAHYYPDIPELQSLEKLQMVLYQYLEVAREANQ